VTPDSWKLPELVVVVVRDDRSSFTMAPSTAAPVRALFTVPERLTWVWAGRRPERIRTAERVRRSIVVLWEAIVGWVPPSNLGPIALSRRWLGRTVVTKMMSRSGIGWPSRRALGR
jgi:hypothetical protein